MSRLAALAPQAARRHLDERQQKVHRGGERVGIAVRPALVQQRPKLRGRTWTLVEKLSPRPEQRLQVDAVEPAGERGDADIAARTQEDALVYLLHDRTHCEAIARGDQ